MPHGSTKPFVEPCRGVVGVTRMWRDGSRRPAAAPLDSLP